jgi:ribosomal protein S25
MFTRKWVDRRIERIYTAVALGVIALWLLAAATWGVRQVMALVWLVLGVGLAVPWWYHFRVRRPKKGPRIKGANRVQLADFADRWEERVAGGNGEQPILRKSRLTDVRKTKHGIEARIILPPGVLTTEDAIKATERIASAYEVPLSAVSIEAYRGGVANQAKLIIIDDDPLVTAISFPGPSLREDGSFDLGTYVDGETATMRLWRPKYGAVHMLLAGCTGAGKSGVYNVVLANATSSPLVTTWVLDPQGGQSMPEWMDHVDWAARSTEEGLIMLQAAYDVMMARSRHLATMEFVDEQGNTRRGRGYFEPSEEMPLLTIVIDEAHQLLTDPDATKLVADIVKMARKCGVQLLLATQVPSVEELGGNSTIRDQLASGTAIVLRAQSSQSGRMVFSGAMPVAPHKIPSEMSDGSTSAGLGFTMGSNTRTAIMRTYYVSDRQAYALGSEASPRPLDTLSANAAGLAYANRPRPERPNRTEIGTVPTVVEHAPVVEPATVDIDTTWADELTAAFDDDEQEQPEESASDVDEALLQEAADLVITTQFGSRRMLQRKLRVGYAVSVRLMDLLEERGIVGPDTGEPARAVLVPPQNASLPAVEPVPVPEEAPEPQSPSPAPVTAQEHVLAVLADGHEATKAQIVAAIPVAFSDSAMAQALRKLRDAGRIVRVGQGKYRITDPASDRGTTQEDTTS